MISSARPYRLTLSLSDRRAIDFVGGRYSCGDELWALLHESGVVCFADNEWNEEGDFIYNLPEWAAWNLCDLMREDTEDMETNHPLLGGEVWDKLVDFYQEVE